ncbi:MaoC family dehydratase [Azohydromonas caseinilytica]|uniref:MaoC family dehydratase n=1 Tax=Azohydromonas caseinilytica TaxID=2728836 RepID=A0A848F843_9BURK|nr:MaoC family dehydratase [Azohydromonas caseinilytica]NML14420.1 MaoC family dehydratase [Azohydromonas caseinilytica]
MKFAEFFAGLRISAGPASLSEAEILAFAQAWDPQWFHTDPVAADQGPFKGLIASGWQTCGLAMRLAVEAALQGSESFASPGIAYIKWPNPVRPDEPVRLEATVLEVRRSQSKPDLGVLRWRWELLHEDGRQALELEATSLFDLSQAKGAGV